MRGNQPRWTDNCIVIASKELLIWTNVARMLMLISKYSTIIVTGPADSHGHFSQSGRNCYGMWFRYYLSREMQNYRPHITKYGLSEHRQLTSSANIVTESYHCDYAECYRSGGQ